MLSMDRYLGSLLLASLLSIFLSPIVYAQQPHSIIKTANTERLIPEGIAADSRTGLLYITSIAEKKIIVVDKDGRHKDFISTAYEGFGRGLGIKIDEKRNLLWAVSNTSENNRFVSMAHVFDIKTGKLRFRFVIGDTANRFFNDLVIDENGNAFITATMSGELYFADRFRRTIHRVLKDSLLQFPNGIELGNGKLYIATYSHGLLFYDLKNKKLEKLKGYQNNTYAFNIDGLGLYKNDLFAVYNTDSLNTNNAVLRYTLNKEGNMITGEAIFDKGNAVFREPTTLSIAGNELYLLANSHLAIYNANGETLPADSRGLMPVTILLYKLYY